jgi:putative membrane protein
MSIPTTLITLTGVVTSLLLVFRTNTAYDRFWEGRRLWGQTKNCVRALVRTIWVMAPEKTPTQLLEKQSAINLVIAFAIAVKHYLRAEYGSDYKDLHPYISHIPKYWTPTSIEPFVEPGLDKRHRRRASIEAKENSRQATAPNLPLEISFYIASYIQMLRTNGDVPMGVAGFMDNTLSQMIECLSNFERILFTPIPLAYSIHLSQCVWLFCLALPFQLVKELGYGTIPVTGLAAFTMIGIRLIGEQIENPFGYDANDLPLDELVNVIQAEANVITRRSAPNIDRSLSRHKHSNEPAHTSEDSESNSSLDNVRRKLRETATLLLEQDQDPSSSTLDRD